MTDRAADDRTPVALFVTCVADVVAPEAAAASVAILRRARCDVDVPPRQTCCGQPAWNSGFTSEAATVARASLQALDDALAADPATVVVVPAGSCATMIRLYWPQLFALVGDDAAADRARHVASRTFELTEFLAPRLGPADFDGPGGDAGEPVVYHRSCHLLRELHVVDQPEQLLAAAGCELEPWPTADQCCGFGGTFSVQLPETSVAMADEKLDDLPAGVRTIVGADASCLLQLATRAQARRIPVTTVHIAEVLDRAAAPPERRRRGSP